MSGEEAGAMQGQKGNAEDEVCLSTEDELDAYMAEHEAVLAAADKYERESTYRVPPPLHHAPAAATPPALDIPLGRS
eukprot:3104518-Rhodomonas_salina.3